MRPRGPPRNSARRAPAAAAAANAQRTAHIAFAQHARAARPPSSAHARAPLTNRATNTHTTHMTTRPGCLCRSCARLRRGDRAAADAVLEPARHCAQVLHPARARRPPPQSLLRPVVCAAPRPRRALAPRRRRRRRRPSRAQQRATGAPRSKTHSAASSHQESRTTSTASFAGGTSPCRSDGTWCASSGGAARRTACPCPARAREHRP